MSSLSAAAAAAALLLFVLIDLQALFFMEQMNTHLIQKGRGQPLRKELYVYDFVTLRLLLIEDLY